MFEKIVKFYQHYTRELSLNTSFTYKPKKRESAMIHKFVDSLTSKYTIGDAFLNDYFEFQFNYWSGKKTRFDDFIPIGWIIGPKAIERFEQSSLQSKYVAQLSFARKKIKFLTTTVKQPSIYVELIKHEETLKKQYLNTELGLVMCLENTTLFHPQSKSCHQCRHKQTCLAVLKEDYPNIYNQRKIVNE